MHWCSISPCIHFVRADSVLLKIQATKDESPNTAFFSCGYLFQHTFFNTTKQIFRHPSLILTFPLLEDYILSVSREMRVWQFMLDLSEYVVSVLVCMEQHTNDLHSRS